MPGLELGRLSTTELKVSYFHAPTLARSKLCYCRLDVGTRALAHDLKAYLFVCLH